MGLLGFVLLSEPSWDREQFVRDLKEDWGIDAAASIEEDDEEYRDILLLINDVTLSDGQTIGASEDENLPITRSKGIALEGQTLKIGYGSRIR